MVVTIIVSVLGATWWFTKLFTQSQVSFAELKLGVVSMQAAQASLETEMAAYKASQDLKYDSIGSEIRKLTEILSDQKVLNERVLNLGKSQDRFQTHLDNLEDAFRNFRVGSHISEQAQVGR